MRSAIQPLIVFLLLLWLPVIKLTATIPTTINYGTYTVNTNDVCNNVCTVMPNCTLKIQGNITATFLGGIRVMDRATLIIDGATVSMAPDSRITLYPYIPAGILVPTGHRGAYMQTDNNAVITCNTPGMFWYGILSLGINSVALSSDNAIADIRDTRLEYAVSALNNYAVPLVAQGQPVRAYTYYSGSICAINVHFLNNKRSVNLYKSLIAFVSSNAPDPDDEAINTSAQFSYCLFDYSPGFTETPRDIAYITDCKAVLFHSCTFSGRPAGSAAQYTTTGIRAFNSGFRVEKHGYYKTPCKFINLKTGVEIYNALEVNRRPLIRDAIFRCRYGINAQGTLNPLILNCNFKDNGLSTHYGIYLRNSTGYRVEANDLDAVVPTGPGIVVKNSGGIYNEIYRNQVSNRILGIQSLGNNRTASELSGLKILCNRIETWADVTIMNDPEVVVNGMNRYQYVPSTFGINLSAGNRFLQGPMAGAPYHNYYIESGTNNPYYFRYRRFQFIASEDPVYRNFSIIYNGNNNTCPVHNAGATQPPYPWMLFTSRLAALEQEIDQLEEQQALTGDDSTTLGSLWVAHASLIDSAVLYYQDKDLTDSIVKVYERVTKSYRYKMLLAATYAGQGNYTAARNLLQFLAGAYTIPSPYDLSPEEVAEAEGMALLYECYEWLAANEYDWDNLPDNLKQAVLEREEAPMYDGAMARALLARYEDKAYEPDYRLSEAENIPLSETVTLMGRQEHIYPNPALNTIYMDWNQGKAQLLLQDIAGKTVLQQYIHNGRTAVLVAKLHPGIYIATIVQEGKVMYRQKLVKH